MGFKLRLNPDIRFGSVIPALLPRHPNVIEILQLKPPLKVVMLTMRVMISCRMLLFDLRFSVVAAG